MMISSQKYWSKVYILQIKNKLLDIIVEFFLMNKGINIMDPKSKNKDMSPYYFLFYIQYKFMLL